LTKEDLASYRPKIHDQPLVTDGFSGSLRMCGPPPPSSFAVTQQIVAVMVCKFSSNICPISKPFQIPQNGSNSNIKFSLNFHHSFFITAKFSNYTKWGNPLDGVLDDTEFYHWLIEAQKFAYAQRTKMGDVDFVPAAMELARNMTSQRYLRQILKKVPPRAMFSAYYTDMPISAQVGEYVLRVCWKFTNEIH